MSYGPLRVLVVEDEATVAATLVQGMRAEGFAVYLATRADEGVRLAFADPPDAIVLDINLPDRSGFDVLEEIQGRCTAPVVVLTGRLELGDRLKCFELGAADYVAKPFYFEELVARIRSRLRAREGVTPRVVSWADVVVNLDGRMVLVGDAPVALTRSEFDILAYLLERPKLVASRRILAKRTALSLGEPDVRTVDVHVARVRKKLGEAASAIVTVWGIGYRFDPPPDSTDPKPAS
ncbi:MAG TPA: response regulator transcription factor [Polyangiaceae bacterium]|nr:response regulator transcription factor [Polyangiaceae bacterium]